MSGSVASWPVVIHTAKGFSIVNKAEVHVFLEFSCLFYDPVDFGNLISGSSAFSKSSLNIWKFSVHVLLKPPLVNFGHYFAIVWNECNCAVVWTFFGIACLCNWSENWPFWMWSWPHTNSFKQLIWEYTFYHRYNNQNFLPGSSSWLYLYPSTIKKGNAK